MIAVRTRQSSPNDLLALAESELSRVARLGQVTLLLAFVVMVGIMGLLGITEPSLPSRARAVFAAITAIGVLGTVSALWTLSTRGVVLARHRVIGCRVAVAFAATIVLGALGLGFVKGIPLAFGVAGFGVILLGGTIALLRQENRKFSTLTARRHALAQQLKIGG
jgi:hypothetical protein